MSEDKPVFKADVYLALVEAIVRLGKNDGDECRRHIRKADRLLGQWLIDRPEKSALATAPKVLPKRCPCGNHPTGAIDRPLCAHHSYESFIDPRSGGFIQCKHCGHNIDCEGED